MALCLSAGFVRALNTNVDISSRCICGIFKALVSPKSVISIERIQVRKRR